MIELNLLKLAAAAHVLIHSPPVNVAQCQRLIIIHCTANRAESGGFMSLDFILRHFSGLYELLIILGIICLKLYLMYIRSVFVFAAV